MSLNFSAFEIGRRALQASQFGVTVAGQNIANVNTPGYARVRANFSEVGAAWNYRFSAGNGVQIDGVQAYRDSFVERRLNFENGVSGRLNARQNSVAQVEQALAGGDGSGLTTAFESFFGAFRDLDANPNSVPLRTMVVQKGENIANQFHNTFERLTDIQQRVDAQIRSGVARVNELAEKIADINVQIRFTEGSGGNPNALRDELGVLVNEIAELTGARQFENGDGSITVTIGEGRQLVNGDEVTPLTVESTPPNGFATVKIKGDTAVFDEGALLGFSQSMTDTAEQIDALNQLAAEFADKVNALHTTGTDLDGNAGLQFFDTTNPVTARNISVNALVLSDSRKVVASSLPQPNTSGTIAGEIANLLTDPTVTVGSRTGSFTSIYGELVTHAGEIVRSSESDLETQAAIFAQLTQQREAISGVSVDEEAVSLIQYQRAYEAAARFMKIADEMTQTLLSLAQ